MIARSRIAVIAVAVIGIVGGALAPSASAIAARQDLGSFDSSAASLGAGGAVLAFSVSREAFDANVSSEPTLEVTTTAATGVAAESATFSGVITPSALPAQRESTKCEFEYGTTTTHGISAKCEPSPEYTGTTAVSATVKLQPSTTYHFRLVGTDSGGSAFGAVEAFTTPARTPVAPAISVEAANPSATSAAVRAQIAAGGSSAVCEVQFVEEVQFAASGYAGAASSPCAGGLGEGYSAVWAQAKLEGLRVDTTYHYRFLARNATGTSTGEDETFATFGIKDFSAAVLDREGNQYTQAGGHPYKLVTNLDFNVGTTIHGGHPATDANPKDIITALPPGYLGNVNSTPRCTFSELVRDICNRSAQVGVIHIHTDSERLNEPLYNLVPPAGHPAAIGFRIGTFVSISIVFKVRTGGDYGVDAEALDSSAKAGLEGAKVEVWGVPADPSHNGERECGELGLFRPNLGMGTECSVTTPLVPFLTDPTSCTGPQTESVRADSWQDPESFVTATTTLPGTTGCASVPFTPSVSVQPTGRSADSPTGLITNIAVAQEEAPEDIAESHLRDTVVTLPQGMTVSPSGANGLEACSPEQFRLGDASQPTCPDGSRIGRVEIVTPLLADRVQGSVYVAQQNANPFGSTLAIYLYAAADGAVVKLAGHVSSDPLTGQLTTTFDETPQLPFKSLTVTLEGGEHASLASPESCGTFSIDTSLTPWSGAPSLTLSSPFDVRSGCTGGFAPGFQAGTTSAQAGAYAPFVLSFSRADGEQEPAGLTVRLPAGLTAKLAGVPLCGDAAAAGGACPEASRVGAVQALAGPGSEPLVLHGTAYLTGPYRGAPYGLAVAIPAIAGPFNLGNVVVRQALHIDEHDAHATAVSDPFPTIIDATGANGQTDGFPVRLRRVDVAIDRPSFTINPTNCEPLAISASFISKQGQTAAASSPFQVANCAVLKFKPSFRVSTSGKTSRRLGASLHVKVTYPNGPFGSQANIKSVRVELPKQLPSRNDTLKLACPDHTFETSPTGCPEGSLVGTATARTPILAGPLTGPAYIVSHGGAAFPDLEIVLQGEGVTILLDGKTDIKNGITTSTFATVPDAPVSSFELSLPEGPHSILGAPGEKLCTETLAMPTVLRGQNGAQIERNTPIEVTGCPYALRVLRHRVNGRNLTLTVSVPAAGKLVASGKGVSTASKSAKGRQTLTLSLKERGPGKLRTKIALRFTPAAAAGKQRGKSAKTLHKRLTVTFG